MQGKILKSVYFCRIGPDKITYVGNPVMRGTHESIDTGIPGIVKSFYNSLSHL